MKNRFHGGIHPEGRKELSRGSRLEFLPAPKEVVIPLRQHIGLECKSLVSVGDHVFLGQKIGDAEGLCVPVHATVSGYVVALEKRAHISGTAVESVVIENDYKDEWDPSIKERKEATQLSREALLDIIREAGIVGMGGATFPTGVKANVPASEIDTVIVNASECEPYITADDILIVNYAEKVLKGLEVMMRITEPKKVYFAIEDNKKEAIAVLEKMLPSFPEVELSVLPTRYPQGYEKQLITVLTGREVPSGKLPKDTGCVVFNAATYKAIYDAVYLGRPLIERIVTLSGEGMVNPGNRIVRIGTPISYLLDSIGGVKEETVKIVAGGPMMGTSISDLSSPVVKGTNAVLALLENIRKKDGICIRCGRCYDHCPMHLQPLFMYRFSKAENMKMLEKLHVTDCMECGCCSYVCPAGLPLTETFKASKKLVAENRRKK